MNELIVKTFENKQVRTSIDENGNPWFVAQDVCELLEIKYQASALRKLDPDQRGGATLQGEGGNREFSTVSESGLYELIIRSDKPQAKPFRKWITTELLPAIRKTGQYVSKHSTPGEQLVASAQAYLQLERAVGEANRNIQVNQTHIEKVETKVVEIDQTMNNLIRHRTGKDPVPAGTAPSKAIRIKYFFGVSEDVIRQYLGGRGHPCVPFTYVTKQGTDIQSKTWKTEGLTDAYEELIMNSVYIKETPKKWMFAHDLIDGNFGFKKDEVPANYRKLIERKAQSRNGEAELSLRN